MQTFISVNINPNQMLASITKSPLFFPLYLGFIILALTIVIFLLDKDTPNAVFIILLGMHIGLLIYSWRQYKKKPDAIKIPSLSDYKNSSKRPPKLASFEAEAQSILRQINMQNNPRINQIQYYSPYSSSSTQSLSLADLKSPTNEYPQDTNIFGTYNIQTWRQQFRLALQQFKQNLATEISNKNAYENVLAKLNLNVDNLKEAEDIVETFLKDRATQYCTYTIKVVNQINRILSRNFGLSLTKIPSTNNKEIGMDQFYRLIDYYMNNRSLPSMYKNLLVSSPSENYGIMQIDLNIGRQSVNKLQSDMLELAKYSKVLEPMILFPQQRFNSSLLVYILRSQFPNQKIQINSQSLRTNPNFTDSNNVFNSIFLSTNNNYVHIFTVQVDYWINLLSMPEFRTKNCLKICLVFLLVLIKRQSSIGHPMLRTLRRLLK